MAPLCTCTLIYSTYNIYTFLSKQLFYNFFCYLYEMLQNIQILLVLDMCVFQMVVQFSEYPFNKLTYFSYVIPHI